MYTKRQETLYSCFDPLLSISNASIGFIGDDSNKMFKYLGRFIQHDLKTDRICTLITNKLVSWLNVIEKAQLTGPMKCWILNHGVLSRLSWLLLIQDLPRSALSSWHRYIHNKYRRWLGLANSTEPSVIYRSRAHFGLNFKDIREFTRHLKVIQSHILKYSKDPSARKLYKYMLDQTSPPAFPPSGSGTGGTQSVLLQSQRQHPKVPKRPSIQPYRQPIIVPLDYQAPTQERHLLHEARSRSQPHLHPGRS